MTTTGHRRDLTRRIATGIVFIVHVVAWIALPVADARAEARSVGAIAHAESSTSKACAPVHQHAACSVCRTLRTFGVASSSPTLPPASMVHVFATAADPGDVAAFDLACVLQPRAPPAS